MVRVDYSGLNWKKIGIPTKMTHRNCGGRVWYSKDYKSYFCSCCGHWLDAIPNNTIKPSNAVCILNNSKH